MALTCHQHPEFIIIINFICLDIQDVKPDRQYDIYYTVLRPPLITYEAILPPDIYSCCKKIFYSFTAINVTLTYFEVIAISRVIFASMFWPNTFRLEVCGINIHQHFWLYHGLCMTLSVCLLPMLCLVNHVLYNVAFVFSHVTGAVSTI